MALRFFKCVAVVTFVHALAAAIVFGAYFATKAGNRGGGKTAGSGTEFVLVDKERPPVVVHEVASGETYPAIARAYGVSVQALLEANGRRDGQALRSGDRLIIPGRD